MGWELNREREGSGFPPEEKKFWQSVPPVKRTLSHRDKGET